MSHDFKLTNIENNNINKFMHKPLNQRALCLSNDWIEQCQTIQIWFVTGVHFFTDTQLANTSPGGGTIGIAYLDSDQDPTDYPIVVSSPKYYLPSSDRFNYYAWAQ